MLLSFYLELNMTKIQKADTSIIKEISNLVAR